MQSFGLWKNSFWPLYRTKICFFENIWIFKDVEKSIPLIIGSQWSIESCCVSQSRFNTFLLTGSTLITSRALVNKDEISSIAWITYYYYRPFWLCVYICDLFSLLTVFVCWEREEKTCFLQQKKTITMPTNPLNNCRAFRLGFSMLFCFNSSDRYIFTSCMSE